MSDYLKAKFLDDFTSLKRLGESLAKFQGLLEVCSQHLEGARAEFSLVSLTKNSPPSMCLAPKSDADQVDRLMKFVADTVKQVNEGGVPDCPRTVLRSFLIGTRFEFAYSQVEASTSDLFESNLKSILRRKRREFLSVLGKIEAIDIHEKLEFRIYPKIGKAVRCQFEPQYLGEVLQAIGKLSEVFGLGVSESADGSLDYLLLERIRVVEARPLIANLRGIAKDAYGDVDSVSHVRKFRDKLERELTGG